MKQQSVVPLVITFVVAGAAGIAIAGLPSEAPGDDLVITVVPTTSLGPAPTAAPLEVEPLDASDPATDTVPDSTTSPTTAPTTETSSTIGPPTTSAFLDLATTTTDTATTEDPADQLRSRATLSVATANAAIQPGVAAAHADELEALGYVGVTPTDSEPVDVSAVYYQPGFDLEASRMSDELGWGLFATAPSAELPALETDQTFELVAVVGLDDE